MIQHIKQRIAEVSGIEAEHISYSPERRSFGDLAISLFKLAKQKNMSPVTLAEEIAKKISLLEIIDRTDFVNGYLNIKLKWSSIFKLLLNNEPLVKTKFSDKVLIEYSQPNTHKPFHVGHLRNACLGSSLVNLCELLCSSVISVNYPGDIGTHVARCIWYIVKQNIQELPSDKVVDFLGECYFNAVQLLELENLTEFPYTNCFFGRVLESTKPNYKIQLKDVVINAFWPGDELKTGVWCVIANRSSKVFRLVYNKDIEYDWIVVPKKIISSDANSEAIVLENTPENLDPLEFFRKDKSVKDLYKLFLQRNQEVSQILTGIENKKDPSWSLWLKTREECLRDFEKIYQWLGCKFNHYFFESELTEEAKNLVDTFLKKGIFSEKDGAVGIDLGQLGFFVLRKSDGNVLYSTRDLVLAFKKREMFDYDKSIYIVDQAQSLHFRQVFETLRKIDFPDVDKLFHLGYALVITKEGKISSRSKNYYTFWELKDLATKLIMETYYSQAQDVEEAFKISEKLAKACIRYGMLKVENSSPVVFDLQEWLNIHGNSGAYISYTYARLKSVLDKSNHVTHEILTDSLEQEEIEILSYIIFLEEVLIKAYRELSPHIICEYLYKLSQSINKFYNKLPILKSDEGTQAKRLKIVDLSLKAMETCMDILGIDKLARV